LDKIIVIACITEALWETIKLFKNPKGLNFDRVGAVILGIVIAAAGRLDIFSFIGFPLSIKYLGYILTGLLISRGSNFVHDILGTVGGVYQGNKSSKTVTPNKDVSN
jgi:hypothetical protein